MIRVDTQKCQVCGTCVSICPESALLLIMDKLIYDPSRCKVCLICIDICPTHAIGEAEILIPASPE